MDAAVSVLAFDTDFNLFWGALFAPTFEDVVKAVHPSHEPCTHIQGFLSVPGPQVSSGLPNMSAETQAMLWQWFSESIKWLKMGASWVVPGDIVRLHGWVRKACPADSGASPRSSVAAVWPDKAG